MNARLNRLFADDGRCFDVAVDHGFFGEEQFLASIEDIEQTIVTLAAAGPDAIQLSPGQAPILQALPGAKPALVLRVDVGNVYGAELDRLADERGDRARVGGGGAEDERLDHQRHRVAVAAGAQGRHVAGREVTGTARSPRIRHTSGPPMARRPHLPLI